MTERDKPTSRKDKRERKKERKTSFKFERKLKSTAGVKIMIKDCRSL